VPASRRRVALLKGAKDPPLVLTGNPDAFVLDTDPHSDPRRIVHHHRGETQRDTPARLRNFEGVLEQVAQRLTNSSAVAQNPARHGTLDFKAQLFVGGAR